MSDDVIISKVLNIVEYYIDNYRQDIKTNWSNGKCIGFTVSSNKSYVINITKSNDSNFNVECVDKYGHKVIYFSNNQIFSKFVDKSIDRILNDCEIDVLERIEKEHREINTSKIING